MSLTVTWQTTMCLPRAKHLSESLHLPLAEQMGNEASTPYTLYVTEERLELVFREKGRTSRLSSEFVKGPLGYRRIHGGGKTQAIAKAMGLKNLKEDLNVLDVTAGLGQEGFILASLGCTVQLVERSPIMAALLLDGLSRAEQNPNLQPLIRSMTVQVVDAKHVLQGFSKKHGPQVVYMDPMFPSKNKSALSKIEMRIIRDIVGEDNDAGELLSLALTKAKNRVVVKRPNYAPSLLCTPPPSFVVEGKSSRYDVYLTRYSHPL